MADSVVPMSLKCDQFAVELLPGVSGPVVRFRGTISTADPTPALNRFVDRMNCEIAASGAVEVKVDLTALEFVNSCGFKSFIYWVELLRALPEERRYALEFEIDSSRRWQKTSVQVLSCFAPSSIRMAAA